MTSLVFDMRNWLAHVYFDINLDVLWNVVTNLLPPLIVQLEDILNSKEDLHHSTD